MTKKALLGLGILLGLLAAGLWLSDRRESGPANTMQTGAGTLLDSVDLSSLQDIVLEDDAATTHLSRIDGIWRLSEKDNVPADVNRLRRLIQSIDGMKPGLVMEEGSGHLAEYGLDAEGDPPPFQIELTHARGTTRLRLGKRRESRNGMQSWRLSPGRYVQVDDGPIRLLAEDLAQAQADPALWWDRLLLQVPPDGIQRVEAGTPDARFTIERGTNGTYSLAGAVAEESVDPAAANRLFGALRGLRAEDLLSDEAFVPTAEYKASSDAADYRVTLGEARPDRGGACPVRIEVTSREEAAPEQKAVASVAEKRLAGRTFLVPAGMAEPLRLKKEELLKRAESVPPEAEDEATAKSTAS